MQDKIILKQDIEKAVLNFVENSLENDLHYPGRIRAWGVPVFGYGRGDDELFSFYKKHIGSFYWSPKEIFEITFPDELVKAEELSIISWGLPQTIKTKRSNRKEKQIPSEDWIRSRHYGEIFNNKLRHFLEDFFKTHGIKAVSPGDAEPFAYQQNDATVGLASNWSERHTAYLCGLGTFGLSDGFISSIGMAARFGSTVFKLPIEPTKRTYSEPYENCKYFYDKSCTACIKRCPANAISEKGHDKEACFNYIRKTIQPYASNLIGEVVTPCGLCQVGVPCESQVPKRKKSVHDENLPL